MVIERTYVVEGMTCGHCKAAVEQEVGALTGVEEVRVDLASGHVTVVGEGVDDEAVAAAVDTAGYAVRS